MYNKIYAIPQEIMQGTGEEVRPITRSYTLTHTHTLDTTYNIQYINSKHVPVLTLGVCSCLTT